MFLKQAIVVRNEFSTRGAGGKGSRGSSPAAYMDYMTRDSATENVTPIRLKTADSIEQRHVNRETAVEEDSLPKLKLKLKKVQSRAGVAFCNDTISMSREQLQKKKQEMEQAFQDGHTWFKTVLSFSPEYLEEMGIVQPGFVCRRKGGYRGHVDQMKLRAAIMHGLGRMGHNFDNLQYVGTIQVDTWHVHCHLSMMDMGQGQLAPDGRQRGKLSAKDKSLLRRGVDSYLDENQLVKHMSSNVQYDRHNTVCYVKRFTHQAMDERGTLQFLLACLPDDSRLWRATSNRREMQKPNYIVRSYVNELLSRPGSGYRAALTAVDKYAQYRKDREGLSDEEYREIYRRGQQGIITDCMNGVYSVLRKVPEEQRRVRTPMMTAMAQSYETMAEELVSDPMVEFGFRLRSYATRLDYHKKEKQKYESLVQQAEQQTVDESARPFVDFLKFEQEYNTMLMAKYQHFLLFLPRQAEYEDEFMDVVKKRRRLQRVNHMLQDDSLKRMKDPDRAEAYGRKVYDLRGGRYMVTDPGLLIQRQAELQDQWNQDVERFQHRLQDAGMRMESDETGALRVKQHVAYEFDDVKSLDLHHLSFDFPVDVPVSRVNAEHFISTANQRYELYQAAKQYLINTGQEQGLRLLPSRDVEAMKELADTMKDRPVLVRKRLADTGARKRGRTVALDRDFQEDVNLAVRLAVDSQIEMMS